METSQNADAGSRNTNVSHRGRPHQRRIERGRFAPRTVTERQPTHTNTQTNTETQAHHVGNSSDPAQTRGRGRRGHGHTRGGRNAAANNTNIITGRRFGGNLTSQSDLDADPDTAMDHASLQPQAPAFIPGQIHPAATKPRAHRPVTQQPRQRRLSKSQAPDIATRTHEDVDNGHYECAVCTNEIYRNSKVWSCHTCWTVFHISCVKKWSQSEGAKVAQRQQAGDSIMPPSQQWRCPGCNLAQDRVPTSFTCWCEKEVDPRSIPGLPPFSCGQSCSREHTIPKKCPHPCKSICHAGPCPPCSQMGPMQTCFCGREQITKRCLDTDYESGFSCNNTCGEPLPCGEHFCDKPCHEGLCGACEALIEARCYCGQVEKQILCCEKGDEKPSSRAATTTERTDNDEQWFGIFDCNRICNRLFDCGQHACERQCHPQEYDVPHCPRSPDVVDHCPCGKTLLKDISDHTRRSCTDPIPSCLKPCQKRLGCAHACQQPCHTGDCPPCLAKITIACRCGRTTLNTMCHQGRIEQPECMRICKATLNCGRHECGEHCCSGESKAAARQATKRKLRSLVSASQLIDDGFEAEHICTRVCGRSLKCGNHTCHELCHRGPCNSCREAIFDEVSCHCGRTVLQPPLPCGTRPPPCRFPCERPKTCGHPQVSHACHQDDEACPKCPFLTTKPCLCGKHQLKNQPCWLTDVRCGELCGRKLKCGFHLCRKPCHRPGECEDAGAACTQACGKEKSCGHPCEQPCHSPFPCKEDKPCQFKIYITCDCQRIKQEAKCGATKTNEGNNKKSLKCDEECARLERNRKLALALNVDPETHTNDHIPYSADTLNKYLNNIQWATEQEKALRVFAADISAKRMRFKPMVRDRRAFLHALAEDFGFDTESMDPEPHRHVAVWKTPKFVMAPMKTLAECARIRRVQNIATATAAVEAAAAKKQKASNLVGEPYNGYVVTSPRFGLTVDELRSVVTPVTAGTDSTLQFDISFLPSEEIILKPNAASRQLPERELESLLTDLKPALVTACAAQSIGKLQLCHSDESLNVLRLESDSASSGWSQVAAKAAAPRRTATPVQTSQTQNSFTVLMSSSAAKKKQDEAKARKKQEEKREKELRRKMEAEIEDDWELAEEVQEEKERIAGSSRGQSAAGSVAASVEASGDEGERTRENDEFVKV